MRGRVAGMSNAGEKLLLLRFSEKPAKWSNHGRPHFRYPSVDLMSSQLSRKVRIAEGAGHSQRGHQILCRATRRLVNYWKENGGIRKIVTVNFSGYDDLYTDPLGFEYPICDLSKGFTQEVRHRVVSYGVLSRNIIAKVHNCN